MKNLKEIISKTGYYRLKIITNQPQTTVKEVMADKTVKIAVSAPPEKGRANQKLISYLSKQLGISRTDIRIASGLTSKIKIVHIEIH